MLLKSIPPIPEPVLTGERVILRLATPRDAAAIVEYFKRNRLFHKPTDPLRPAEHYTQLYWQRMVRILRKEFRQDQSVRFFLFGRENPKRVIGSVGFSQIVRGIFHACYLGYALDEHEQGKGLMTEALRVGIAYMFVERKLHRVMANYMPKNERSGRLLAKLGFTIDGQAREYLMINGKWEDHVLTSLINEDWSLE